MSTQEIAQLFDAYYDPIYRFVFFRVSNQHVAEDIVSSIFEKVVRSFDSYAESGRSRSIDLENEDLRKWIYTIARNTVIDHYRTDKSASHSDIENHEADLVDHTPNTVELLDITMDMNRVIPALEKLSDRQKEIVLLRYQSDFSNTEISEMLGIEQRTVSSILSRAIATLKQELATQPTSL